MSSTLEKLRKYTESAKEYVNQEIEKNKVTKTSQLTNDSDFVTSSGTVDKAIHDEKGNDIANTYMTKEEAAKLSQLSFVIVDKLPEQDIKTNVIYLVKMNDDIANDKYQEYIYINNSWEELGHQSIQSDLSDDDIEKLWGTEIENADDKSF